jgi:hypothetical protein
LFVRSAGIPRSTAGIPREARGTSALPSEISLGSSAGFSHWLPRAMQQAREIPREASVVDREAPRDSSSTLADFRVTSRSFPGKPVSFLRWSVRLLREGNPASRTARADFGGKRFRFRGNHSKLIEKSGEIPRQHPRDSPSMRRTCVGSFRASWRSARGQLGKRR